MYQPRFLPFLSCLFISIYEAQNPVNPLHSNNLKVDVFALFHGLPPLLDSLSTSRNIFVAAAKVPRIHNALFSLAVFSPRSALRIVRTALRNRSRGFCTCIRAARAQPSRNGRTACHPGPGRNRQTNSFRNACHNCNSYLSKTL